MVNHSYFPCVVVYLYFLMVNHSYFPCVVVYVPIFTHGESLILFLCGESSKSKFQVEMYKAYLVMFFLTILAHSFRLFNLDVLMYGVDKLGCHIVEPDGSFFPRGY